MQMFFFHPKHKGRFTTMFSQLCIISGFILTCKHRKQTSRRGAFGSPTFHLAVVKFLGDLPLVPCGAVAIGVQLDLLLASPFSASMARIFSQVVVIILVVVWFLKGNESFHVCSHLEAGREVHSSTVWEQVNTWRHPVFIYTADTWLAGSACSSASTTSFTSSNQWISCHNSRGRGGPVCHYPYPLDTQLLLFYYSLRLGIILLLLQPPYSIHVVTLVTFSSLAFNASLAGLQRGAVQYCIT